MAMTSEEMIRFVDDLYDATGTADWDRAASMLTDDFFVSEADTLPMAGVYRGKNALHELFVTVMGIVDVVGLEREQTVASGDCAITILEMRFADPDLAPAQLLEMFRFRDGKCCEIKPYYFNSDTFVAAAEAKRRQTA